MAASATAEGLPDGCRNGKPPNPAADDLYSITDRAPFVPAGRGVQDLALRTTGSTDRRDHRSLDRRDRGRNKATDCRSTKRRQIDGTVAQGLDLAVNAATNARCVGIRDQETRENQTQDKSHIVPPAAGLPRPKPARLPNRLSPAGDRLLKRYFALPSLARDTISIILPSSSSGATAFARA